MVKVNSSFLTKINLAVEKNVRSGFVDLATKRACWGIKGGKDDLPTIMGVLNFGDPAHTFPNHKRNSAFRKALEYALANNVGVKNPSAITPRPWLSDSTKGAYRYFLKKYINENLPKMVAGIKKRGKYDSVSSQRALSVNDFLDGLAQVGADNARDNWESGKFKPNSPATLSKKSDSRPLHDTGVMNAGRIEGWVA